MEAHVADLAYWDGYVAGLVGEPWSRSLIARVRSGLAAETSASAAQLHVLPGSIQAGWSVGFAERVTP